MSTLSSVREATAGREIVALSFGSQLDGMVAADADGEPLRPALIWCDRRAGEECAAVAARVDVEQLRALTGCNLDPGHIAPKIGWLAAHEPDVFADAFVFACPGLVGGMAGDRRAGDRPLQRLLDRPAGPARAGVGGRGVRGVGSTRRGCRASSAPTRCSGRCCRGCARRRGFPETPWWSWARATRWRRRSARAWSSRAWCATCSARPSRSARWSASRRTTRPASSSCTRAPTRRPGSWRTPAGCRAAPTAGSATSSGRRRWRGRRRTAPTSTSCSTTWPRARLPGRAGSRGCPRWRARWRRSGTRTRAAGGSG